MLGWMLGSAWFGSGCIEWFPGIVRAAVIVPWALIIASLGHRGAFL